MATNSYAPIELPEATELADLTGIMFDLRSARDYARTLQKMRTSRGQDWMQDEPLSIAILVKYSRPFAKGVRRHLGVVDLGRVFTDEQREKHEYLRQFRDKHIAHSVNVFETNKPVARFWDESVQAEGISSVECVHTRIGALSGTNVSDVIELTTALLAYVTKLREAEQAKLLALVRAMPLDEILARRNEPGISIDATKVGTTRRR